MAVSGADDSQPQSGGSRGSSSWSDVGSGAASATDSAKCMISGLVGGTLQQALSEGVSTLRNRVGVCRG